MRPSVLRSEGSLVASGWRKFTRRTRQSLNLTCACSICPYLAGSFHHGAPPLSRRLLTPEPFLTIRYQILLACHSPFPQAREKNNSFTESRRDIPRGTGGDEPGSRPPGGRLLPTHTPTPPRRWRLARQARRRRAREGVARSRGRLPSGVGRGVSLLLVTRRPGMGALAPVPSHPP